MAEPGSFFVSSRLVKEVALLGGDLTGVVPEKVRTRLTERVAELTSSRR
jgi:phosphopantetheine adenylyltransferase